MKKLSEKESKAVKEIVSIIIKGPPYRTKQFLREDVVEEDVQRAIEDYEKASGDSIEEAPEKYFQSPYGLIEREENDKLTFVTYQFWSRGEPSDLCAEIQIEYDKEEKPTAFLAGVLVP